MEVPPLVVTKVAKAEDLANLMWWQQGDEAMYTADNLKARARNRSHPDVLAILDVWWQAVTSGGKKASVDRNRYVMVFTKIGLALTEEGEVADAEVCKQQAEQAWEEDRKGNKSLNERLFLDSVFELADVWTVSTDPDEYVEWLTKLFRRLGNEDPPGFKDDADVEQLPAGETLRFATKLARIFPKLRAFLEIGRAHV